MTSRTRRVFVVATALLLSACQPDRALSGWLSQSTTESAAIRPAALTAPNHFVSGWVPYWGTATSRAAIINRSDSIGDVSPLFYGTNDDGTLRLLGPQAQLDATVQATRNAGRPLIVGIFDSAAAGVMTGILADAATRTAHVQNIVNLAVTKQYDGIDLDYEVFAFGHPRTEWPSITPNWVAFVNELSVALHARGLLLSVTVPPVYQDSAGVTRGYTVYAQDLIANAVDRLRLMVYDWSISSPGPIAPMDWVNRVIAYSSSMVPVSKLQLGVPAYGRHWVTKQNSNETCPDGAVYRESVLMKNIDALVGSRNYTRYAGAGEGGAGERFYSWTETVSGPRTKPLTPPVVPPATVTIQEIRAAATGSPLKPAVRLSTPSPLVTCTVQHTVYVPDAYSVDQRSDAAQAAGWRGIIMWAFGYENDNMYTILAQ